MTALSNVTANASESENAVSGVQVWLNGIVEAFCGGKSPIKAAYHHPGDFKVRRMATRFTIHGLATVQPQNKSGH